MYPRRRRHRLFKTGHSRFHIFPKLIIRLPATERSDQVVGTLLRIQITTGRLAILTEEFRGFPYFPRKNAFHQAATASCHNILN